MQRPPSGRTTLFYVDSNFGSHILLFRNITDYSQFSANHDKDKDQTEYYQSLNKCFSEIKTKLSTCLYSPNGEYAIFFKKNIFSSQSGFESAVGTALRNHGDHPTVVLFEFSTKKIISIKHFETFPTAMALSNDGILVTSHQHPAEPKSQIRVCGMVTKKYLIPTITLGLFGNSDKLEYRFNAPTLIKEMRFDSSNKLLCISDTKESSRSFHYYTNIEAQKPCHHQVNLTRTINLPVSTMECDLLDGQCALGFKGSIVAICSFNENNEINTQNVRYIRMRNSIGEDLSDKQDSVEYIKRDAKNGGLICVKTKNYDAVFLYDISKDPTLVKEMAVKKHPEYNVYRFNKVKGFYEGKMLMIDPQEERLDNVETYDSDEMVRITALPRFFENTESEFNVKLDNQTLKLSKTVLSL